MGLNGVGKVNIDVASQRNGDTAALVGASLSGEGRATHRMQFEVLPGDLGLQFRVYKPRGIGVQVFGVAVHPLK